MDSAVSVQGGRFAAWADLEQKAVRCAFSHHLSQRARQYSGWLLASHPVFIGMPSPCPFSLLLVQRIRWEPQLRSGQDGSVQDFKWMPRTGYQMSNHLGPGTPSAGQEATRQPFTGTNRTGVRDNWEQLLGPAFPACWPVAVLRRCWPVDKLLCCLHRCLRLCPVEVDVAVGSWLQVIPPKLSTLLQKTLQTCQAWQKR